MTTYPAMAVLGTLDAGTALACLGGAAAMLLMSRLAWRSADPDPAAVAAPAPDPGQCTASGASSRTGRLLRRASHAFSHQRQASPQVWQWACILACFSHSSAARRHA